MREIIISIKPHYSSLIFSGAKTVELRKKIGSEFRTGKQIYIYSSSPVKMLSGEATIAFTQTGSPTEIKALAIEKACISEEDYDAYFSHHKKAYAIHLTDVIEYERKIPLLSLRKAGITPPQSYCYAERRTILNLFD
ncbi:hypothetical protein [Pseudomonas kielensis]|uniref:ASCH domain-containing protein n=1 Tax=Pseudomonas kielensis TaxID=2762577 RepID=A0A7X1GC79_9PSED|nr:hypothetical protein [Pseudomonas kielensis]MBC2689794.1 hypothetical protein [Pseudomonas kielensis]